MKDFITSIASLMLLMIFVMQFAANQAVYTKLVETESCVSLFRDSAEERGEIASEDISTLRQNAAAFLDCAPTEIGVDTQTLESGNAGYDISVPLKNVIGAAKFLGISSAENEAKYHFRGVILTREEEEEIEDKEDKTVEPEDSGRTEESGPPEGQAETEDKDGEKTEEAENEEHDNDHGTDDNLLRTPEIPDGA